jgi:hypothetical protein
MNEVSRSSQHLRQESQQGNWDSGKKEMLQMKNSINQIKTVIKHHQYTRSKRRLPVIKDKIKDLLHLSNNKEKKKMIMSWTLKHDQDTIEGMGKMKKLKYKLNS